MILADFVGMLESIEIMKTYVPAKNLNIQNFDVITECLSHSLHFQKHKESVDRMQLSQGKGFLSLNLFHSF